MTHRRPTTLPLRALGAMALALTTAAAQAQEWSTVPIIEHSTYQAVDSGGNSTYDKTEFPIRLRGVVLNNNEDWLNPTADYLPWNDGANAKKLGGEAEIFVQAVNLDDTDWDPDPESDFDDFGGTAAWMGQNYGNLPWKAESNNSYDNEAWHAELDRLGLWYDSNGDGQADKTDIIRAGDLIEIRARGGLYYAGKMNVNEQHDNESFDFELEILQKGYGLPEPHTLALSDLKDSANKFIFDDTRQTGGERYQSTLVTLEDVSIVEDSWDQAKRQLTVTDGEEGEINVRFGWNVSVPNLSTPTNLTGILNQDADTGQGGYYLVVVPEPASLVLLGLAVCLGLARRRRG